MGRRRVRNPRAPAFAAVLVLALALPAAPVSPVLASLGLVPVSRTGAACAGDPSALILHPNIETVGVVLEGRGLPRRAQLLYRKVGASGWIRGHHLVRVDDGRLAGSLFGLEESSAYQVRVVVSGTATCRSVTTKPDVPPFTPTETLHVDDDAPSGGDGSAGAPFDTIQEAVDAAGPGTRVLVADGLYREEVAFPTGGNEGAWLQVVAAGGRAVLDGSVVLSGDGWSPHPSVDRVWSRDVGRSFAYLARDGQRSYRYNNLQGLLAGKGDDGVPIAEGWFQEPGNTLLWVRSSSDPAGHVFNVPRHDHGFQIEGIGWVWVEGFEIRYYGRGEWASGVLIRDSSHAVVRDMTVHGVTQGIVVRGRSNDARIEGNDVSDPPVDSWPRDAVKGTSHEGAGIVVSGRRGAIVRGNEVHHIFNGIYACSWDALEDTRIAFDVDAYENELHDIGDDGLEPEGACINNRFRENRFTDGLVGISLAPITSGPVWVIGNIFANHTGTGFKWGNDGDGRVFVYHNTSWTVRADDNGMDIYARVHNVTFLNNIVRGTRYAFESTVTGCKGHHWDYDDWFTTLGNDGPHFKWENVRYDTITDLCSATGLECSGHEWPPGLVDPAGGDFSLDASSQNIDAGVLIPGVNDGFLGLAPDVGCCETG
ncbi:MAG: right-handed parallel beta-helix repeat-containing protein [Actinomycetota bacterium]